MCTTEPLQALKPLAAEPAVGTGSSTQSTAQHKCHLLLHLLLLLLAFLFSVFATVCMFGSQYQTEWHFAIRMDCVTKSYAKLFVLFMHWEIARHRVLCSSFGSISTGFQMAFRWLLNEIGLHCYHWWHWSAVCVCLLATQCKQLVVWQKHKSISSSFLLISGFSQSRHKTQICLSIGFLFNFMIPNAMSLVIVHTFLRNKLLVSR